MATKSIKAKAKIKTQIKTKIKSKTKKANKIAKKAVKSISKKSTKNIKKAIISKPKVKSSSKPASSKVRPKSKPKLKAMRITTTKKKHATTDNKSLTRHIPNKISKKSATKKKAVHKLPVDISYSSVESNLGEPAVLNPEVQSDVLLSSPAGKFEPYKIHSSEEYMNEQQLQHFTEILHNWKQDLMMEVDHTISEMKEADVLADLNDRATQEETFNLELRARDRERKLIKKIETALNKIKHHEYGYCDSCGVEIGVRRLEARPTATLCIECKTLAEIREKRV